MAAPEPYRILGIDPGLANTGWGVIEVKGQKRRAVAYGCVSTLATDERPLRLKQLHDGLRDVIARYQPNVVAIESVYFGSNAKSALLTGEARGAVLLAVAYQCLASGEYSPTQVKQVIVGAGWAAKGQVQYMVKAFLGLDHEPTPDHAADALAIAICHAQLGRPYSAEPL